MMPSSRSLGTALMCLGILCIGSAADAAVQVRGSEQLRFQVGDRAMVLVLTPERWVGPGGSLHRVENSLRGTLLGDRIQLSWQDNRIWGHIGENPVELSVIESAAASETLRGEVGGEVVNLVTGPMSIRGVVGSCRYTLAAGAGTYAGGRDCGEPLVPLRTRLQMPQHIADLPPQERAAILLLVLSDEFIPPFDE